VNDNGSVWTPFLVVSLLAGLAAFVWSLTVDLSGWKGIPALVYFLTWLAVVSCAFLGVLWDLRGSLRSTGIGSVVIFCVAVQLGLMIQFGFVAGGAGRLALAFMPAMLILIAAGALSGKAPPEWSVRAAPWLALAGIAFMGAAIIREIQEQRATER
jgi:hypothetical protein